MLELPRMLVAAANVGMGGIPMCCCKPGRTSAYRYIVFFVASLVASQAQAILLYVDFSHNPGDGTIVTGHEEGTSGTVADSLAIIDASGQASAEFGKIRADAQASWLAISSPDPQRFDFRGASSTGGWQDQVTINAPVPLGTQGTFTAKLRVNGTLNASGNGNAGWILNVDLSAGPSLDIFDNFAGNCFGPWHDIPCDAASLNFGTFTTRPFTFQFGSSFSLEVSFNAGASGQQIVTGSASADLFSNSLTWLGFDQVLDENQNPVSNFTVVADSGFDWSQPHPSFGAIALVSSVLPSSRSVQVGDTATAFATIINAGTTQATSCDIAPLTSVPAGFSYQTTDPATNALIGTPDTPVDIAAGALQTFLFAFTPTADIAPTDVPLSYDCANTEPAAVTPGLNTLLLSASATPVPDIVALGATPTGDGTLRLPGVGGSGAFAVASVNVGSTGTITATPGFGSASLPVALSICETDPATGACLEPAAASVTTSIAAGATPTFAIFATATADVPFNPASSRIFVSFTDAGGITRGSTSVAVTTAP